MNNYNDEDIRKKITDAVHEPQVSAEFVERMVVRANAIVVGREAEKELAEASPEIKKDELCDLAAKSIVGRLMLENKPAQGASLDDMIGQMKAVNGFASFASSAPQILKDIRTGAVYRKLSQPQLTGKENQKIAAEVKNKETNKIIKQDLPKI